MSAIECDLSYVRHRHRCITGTQRPQKKRTQKKNVCLKCLQEAGLQWRWFSLWVSCQFDVGQTLQLQGKRCCWATKCADNGQTFTFWLNFFRPVFRVHPIADNTVNTQLQHALPVFKIKTLHIESDSILNQLVTWPGSNWGKMRILRLSSWSLLALSKLSSKRNQLSSMFTESTFAAQISQIVRLSNDKICLFPLAFFFLDQQSFTLHIHSLLILKHAPQFVHSSLSFLRTSKIDTKCL